MDTEGDASYNRASVSSEDKDGAVLTDTDAVASYWTLERMQNAKPRRGGEAAAQPKGSHCDETIPLVAATGRVRDITVPPYNAVGKLFATGNNEDHAGSGSMIGSNTLLTAAHNIELNEAGLPSFSGNFKFCLQYINGGSAQDLYCGSIIFPGTWLVSQASRDDWALLKTTTALNAVAPLDHFVARIADNTPAVDVGYPADAPYDGMVMWESSSDVTFDVGNGIYVMESDLTHGASGGPLIAADAMGNDKVFSVHCERNGANIDGPELGAGFANALVQFGALVAPWGRINLPDSGFNHVALLCLPSMPNYAIAACSGGLYGFNLQTGALTAAKRIDLGYGSGDMRVVSDGADNVYIGITGGSCALAP